MPRPTVADLGFATHYERCRPPADRPPAKCQDVAMTHVLHIVDMNPNKRGPVELQLAEMARQSRERQWQMDVCFPTPAPEWYHSEMTGHSCGVHSIADLNGAGVDEALDLVTPETIVHLHFGKPRRYGAQARKRGARAVFRTEHTYLAPSSQARRRVRALRYRGADVTIACSRYIAEQSVREYRVRPDALRTVLNGVDVGSSDPQATTSSGFASSGWSYLSRRS